MRTTVFRGTLRPFYDSEGFRQMRISRGSDAVRPFTEEDIPQVADLHGEVFGFKDETAPELLRAYRTYLIDVFLNNPWRDERIGPLVHEAGDGKITGFLGVIPRRMSMNGRAVVGAVCSDFCVDPRSRGLAGLKLMSAFLSGPQDLSIADEANDASRKIWEGLGGTTSLLYSIRWTRPLRPAQLALSFLKKRKGLKALWAISAFAARPVDALAARIQHSPFHQSVPRVSAEDLTCETLLACWAEFAGKQSLRLEHDQRSLSWFLDRAAQMKLAGRFQKVMVRTERNEVAGWYLYYLNPGGMSQVLQLVARKDFTHGVLSHLCYHAWKQGAAAVTGKLGPAFIRALADNYCLFQPGSGWMLIHSANRELLNAFHRGDAFFSRFEGEWCHHFR